MPPAEWQRIDPQLTRDLDYREIRELNRSINSEEEMALPPRRQSRLWQVFLAVGVALLIIVALNIGWLGNLGRADYSLLRESAALYADPQIWEQRAAVVLIEGSQSRGTGFNIAADGLLVTNRHVLEQEKTVLITFPDGRQFSATAANWLIDEAVDLALIDIDGRDLPFATLADSLPEAGNEVFFIGNPLGWTWIAGAGKVKVIYFVGSTQRPTILIEGKIRPGNSGSPLFNADGQVIGVIFASVEGQENSGLALPQYLVRDLVNLFYDTW